MLRIYTLGFRVQGLGIRVKGLGFRIWDSGLGFIRGLGLRFRMQDPFEGSFGVLWVSCNGVIELQRRLFYKG